MRSYWKELSILTVIIITIMTVGILAARNTPEMNWYDWEQLATMKPGDSQPSMGIDSSRMRINHGWLLNTNTEYVTYKKSGCTVVAKESRLNDVAPDQHEAVSKAQVAKYTGQEPQTLKTVNVRHGEHDAPMISSTFKQDTGEHTFVMGRTLTNPSRMFTVLTTCKTAPALTAAKKDVLDGFVMTDGRNQY